MFWLSMSPIEAEHIVAAFAFELGKVGIHESALRLSINSTGSTTASPVRLQPNSVSRSRRKTVDQSHRRPLSPDQAERHHRDAKIAILAADGVDVEGTQKLIDALREYGAIPEVLAPVGRRPNRRQRWRAGRRSRAGDDGIRPLRRRGGALRAGRDNHAVRGRPGRAFRHRAYKHHKAVAAFGAGLDLLRKAGIPNRMAQDTDVLNDQGVVTTASGRRRSQ